MFLIASSTSIGRIHEDLAGEKGEDERGSYGFVKRLT